MKSFSIILVLLFCGLVCGTQAQTQSQRGSINAASQSSKDDDGDDRLERLGSPQLEFLHRTAIARLESEHRKNKERAVECAALSIEIEKAFRQSHAPDADFKKRIERIEKLTKRIREYAGGSDDQDFIGMSEDLDASLARLTTVAERMRLEVEKTPRRVVSAKIIGTTNELLSIVRYVRSLTRL